MNAALSRQTPRDFMVTKQQSQMTKLTRRTKACTALAVTASHIETQGSGRTMLDNVVYCQDVSRRHKPWDVGGKKIHGGMQRGTWEKPGGVGWVEGKGAERGGKCEMSAVETRKGERGWGSSLVAKLEDEQKVHRGQTRANKGTKEVQPNKTH